MSEVLLFGRFRNYIGLHGDYIDRFATLNVDSQVPEHCRLNRQKRDGDNYHVTVINPPELKTIMDNRDDTLSKKQYLKSKKSEIDQLYGQVDTWEKPVDLGLGICQDGDAITYFKVIHWPLGQDIRKKVYNLETVHFHITVGFQPRDVHLYKGPGSLCDLRYLACSEERLNSLIKLVPFYWKDKIFMKALLKQCWHLKAAPSLLKLSILYELGKEHAHS